MCQKKIQTKLGVVCDAPNKKPIQNLTYSTRFTSNQQKLCVGCDAAHWIIGWSNIGNIKVRQFPTDSIAFVHPSIIDVEHALTRSSFAMAERVATTTAALIQRCEFRNRRAILPDVGTLFRGNNDVVLGHGHELGVDFNVFTVDGRSNSIA